MAFNTDEVNFLVYRYLEESASVVNAGIESTLVPRGALMSLLQKGILFTEAEVLSLVASNADGAELEQKFEKTIGSMSLIESTMAESVRVKAMERRIREDLSSRTCSPHPGTSASTANPTPQPPALAVSQSTTATSDNLTNPSTAGIYDISTTSTNSTSISQQPSTILPGQQQSIKTGSLPASSTIDRISPMVNHHSGPGHGTNSSVPINPCYRATQQREREFRAQQNTANITAGIPPRGTYRATQASELSSKSHLTPNQVAHHPTSAQVSVSQGNATIGMHHSAPPSHQLQYYSMPPSSNLNPVNPKAALDNGLSLHFHQQLNASALQATQNAVGAGVQGKLADHSDLISQRLLTSNGNCQSLTVNSGQKKTIRLDSGIQIGKVSTNNGNNPVGSVFNSPYSK